MKGEWSDSQETAPSEGTTLPFAGVAQRADRSREEALGAFAPQATGRQIPPPASNRAVRSGFYCHEEKLVVELDGGGHAEEGQAEYDAARSQALAREGIRVLRFWNGDVMENVEGVLETIRAALTEKERGGAESMR